MASERAAKYASNSASRSLICSPILDPRVKHAYQVEVGCITVRESLVEGPFSGGLDGGVALAGGPGFDVAGVAAEVGRVGVGGDRDVVPAARGCDRGGGLFLADAERRLLAVVRVGDRDLVGGVGGDGEVDVAGVGVLARGDLQAGGGLALEGAEEAVGAVDSEVGDAAGVDRVPAVGDGLA